MADLPYPISLKDDTLTITPSLAGLILQGVEGLGTLAVNGSAASPPHTLQAGDALTATGEVLAACVRPGGLLSGIASSTHLLADGAQLYAASGAPPTLEVRVGGVTYTLPLSLQHPATVYVNQQGDPGSLYKTHSVPSGFDPAQDTLNDAGGGGLLTHNAGATQDSDLAPGEYRLVGLVAHYYPVLPSSWPAFSFTAAGDAGFGVNMFYLNPAPPNIISGETTLQLRDYDGNTQALDDRMASGNTVMDFTWEVYGGSWSIYLPHDSSDAGSMDPPWQSVEIVS